MSYGALIHNDNGDVIIDENYDNFVVYSSGVSTTNSGIINVPIGKEFRLFARHDTGYYMGSITDGSNPSTTGEISVLGIDPTLVYTVPSYKDFIFQYVLMLKASEAGVEDTSQNYGFQVFKPDSSLAFSSRYNTMQFAAAYKYDEQTPMPVNYAIPVAEAGNKMFIDISGVWYYGGYLAIPLIDGSGIKNYGWSYFTYISGSNLVFTATRFTVNYDPFIPANQQPTVFIDTLYPSDINIIFAEYKA